MTQREKIYSSVIDWLVEKHQEPNIKNHIDNLPNEDKLNAILMLIGDSGLSYKNFIDGIKQQTYCGELADRNVKSVWDYVWDSSDIKTKEFGEVMTPITLVNEMLDKLPIGVWSNPNLKWLDPCNGVGTFAVVAHKRLMEGLSSYIEDPCDRSKHILENMIYVCELQDKNMILYMSLIDTEYNEDVDKIISLNNNINLYSESFLDKGFSEHMLNVWGIEKFDIIMGNPPYNKPGTSNSGNTIWPKFVDKIITQISEGGYMCIVHPSLWRRPQHKTWNLLTQFQILHLDIHDTQDGMRIFNAGTRYDWYVLNKIPIYTTTTIRFEDGEIMDIDLLGRNFLPNKNITLIDTFTNGDDLCEIIHSCSDYEIRKPWMSKTQTETHIYPCINSILNDGSINWWYSSRNDNGHFNIPKIIISDSTGYLLNDYNGNYGLTSHSLGIVVENENISTLMEKALNSKKFKQVGDSIKWSSFWVDPRFFKYLKKDFYKQFVDENGNEI
jgi:hypothetical protein